MGHFSKGPSPISRRSATKRFGDGRSCVCSSEVAHLLVLASSNSPNFGALPSPANRATESPRGAPKSIARSHFPADGLVEVAAAIRLNLGSDLGVAGPALGRQSLPTPLALAPLSTRFARTPTRRRKKLALEALVRSSLDMVLIIAFAIQAKATAPSPCNPTSRFSARVPGWPPP